MAAAVDFLAPGSELEKHGAETRSERPLQPSGSDPKVLGESHRQSLPAVPDHTLLRCIGRGAYGTVWLARNVMGAFRAVKIVHREDFGRDRPFLREYEGLLHYEPISRSHPNLMQILHVGGHYNYFYYVTELADDAESESPMPQTRERGAQAGSPESTKGAQEKSPGTRPGSSPFPVTSYVPRTLQVELERRKRLPIRECVSLATSLASALKHLHEHGLVHRDVKPSNVIFVHGVPKLADIGLVATAGDSRSIVGTEGYLPPEGPGTAQADLYALGKLLYEVSAGMNRGDYPRLAPGLADWPDASEFLEFNEVLLRACAKDTARRYHGADELLADLALLERGDSVKRLRRLERHHLMLKRFGAAMLLAGLLISVGWWQSWRAHRVASRHLAQLHVYQGTQRMLAGDYGAALPWLVGALKMEAGDAECEWIHRARIASILRRCPVPVAHFSNPDSKIAGADFHSDGTLLATAHADGCVRLWNIRSGRAIRELRHSYPLVFCEFLPPGNRLFALSVAHQALLWDLTTEHRPPLTFAQALSNGGDLYSVGLNRELGQAYLSKGPHCFPRVHPFTGPYNNLTLRLKLAGEKDVLTVAYELRRTLSEGPPLHYGEFLDTPAEDSFPAGCDSPTEPIWGPVFLLLENSSFGDSPGDTGRIVWDNLRVRCYPSHQEPSPWRMLDDFSGSDLTNWLFFAFPEEKRSCRVENGRLVMACANLPQTQIPSGSMLYLVPFQIRPESTLEVEVDLITVEAPHPMSALSVCRFRTTPFTAPDRPFIAHGRWLATTWWDAPVRLWDLERTPRTSAQQERPGNPVELDCQGWLRDLDFSPDTNWVAAVNRTRRLWVLDFATGQGGTLSNRWLSAVTGARFSLDSRFLAVSHDAGLELLRTTDWDIARTLVAGPTCAQPRFSPRGNRLAAVRDRCEVVVWDLGDPAEAPATFLHQSDVTRVVFSPDGRYLVTSTADSKVQVWDALRREAVGPHLPGALARFSPDGTQLLVFGNGNDVWLWDLTQVMDDTLPVPALRGEQASASSSDRLMMAKLENECIALTTPAGHYSIALPIQTSLSRIAFDSTDRFLIAESLDLRAWVWDVRSRTLLGPPRPIRYAAELERHALPDPAVESRDLRTLLDLAAVLSEQQSDRQGGMVPVADQRRAQCFRSLKQARPAEFTMNGRHTTRWHQEHAEAAELCMDWDAAVFHWERAVISKSQTAEQESRNSVASRLAYARQAARIVQHEMQKNHSRWSVFLPRPPWATPEMLDLSRHYTTALGEVPDTRSSRVSFRQLGTDVKTLCGTAFDVRGIIDLTLTNHVSIPVGQACKRFHFLGAANRPPFNRETVGSFQATYASGWKEKVSLRNPEDLPAYSSDRFREVSSLSTTNASSGLSAILVWSGGGPVSKEHKGPVYLTRTTWHLPAHHYGEIVESIELRAGPAGSAPLIFAITVE